MERHQLPQVLLRFGAALFRAYKQVPGFAEGTFDKDKLYNDELGGLCRITADTENRAYSRSVKACQFGIAMLYYNCSKGCMIFPASLRKQCESGMYGGRFGLCRKEKNLQMRT